MSKERFLEQREYEANAEYYELQRIKAQTDIEQQYTEHIEMLRKSDNRVKLFLAFVILCATISLFYFGVCYAMQKYEMKDMFSKINTLTAMHEKKVAENNYLLHLSTDINLQKLREVYKMEGVTDVENWLCVAILESGWGLESELMRKHNNPIGMGARPMYGSVQGADMLYAKYPSIYCQARDLKAWIEISPRKSNEEFHNFLIRRGYNLNPTYFVHYKEIVKLNNKS